MKNVILLPPLAFLIFFVLSLALSKFSKFVLSVKGKKESGKTKSYECGEDIHNHKVQPDYSQFFPFAFSFTIMHVVTLIIAMAPMGFSVISIIYLFVAARTLIILFRR